VSSCFTTSSSRTTPAKVTTAASLISTYVTGGVPPSSFKNPHFWHSCGHLVQRILIAPPCFHSTSSSGIPISLLQPASSCFNTKSSSGTPPSRDARFAALNSTYNSLGISTFSFNNPHGWHSCGHNLLPILTAPTCFPTTFSWEPPYSRLHPAPTCFQTLLRQTVPRLS